MVEWQDGEIDNKGNSWMEWRGWGVSISSERSQAQPEGRRG